MEIKKTIVVTIVFFIFINNLILKKYIKKYCIFNFTKNNNSCNVDNMNIQQLSKRRILMKNKSTKVILTITSILLCIGIFTNKTYAVENKISKVPVVVQGLQNKEDLANVFKEIKMIRDSMRTIDINTKTIKEKSGILKPQITSYINQLQGVFNNLERHKRIYKDSQPDIFVADQLQILSSVYQALLRDQLILIEGFLKDDPEASKLAFSDYLYTIYYIVLCDIRRSNA